MDLRRSLWQFILAGIAVTLVLSVYADLGALIAALRVFEWRVLPLVLGLTLGNQLLRFIKWEYLLKEVGVELGWLLSFHVFGSGLVMIMTPGKLGEVWKSWLIRDIDGTRISRTVPVIATERISDLLGVVTISFLGVIAFDRSPLVLVALTLPLIVGIVVLQYERACYWILGLVNQMPIVGRWSADIRELYESSRELLRIRPLGVATILSVLSWGLECAGFWFVLQGFDAEVSVLVAAFVFALSSVLGALSLIPGGLGVTEGSMTGLLLVFEVTRATAASATLVIRAATLWFTASLALVVYASLRWRYSLDMDTPNSDEL